MKGNTMLTTDGLHFDEYKKLLDTKTASITLDSTEEAEPDEIDLQMLSEIENDPDCRKDLVDLRLKSV